MTATAPERVEHRYRPVGSAAELFRSRAPEILLSGAAGTGKAQPLDAVVQTPSGPRRMGDITVGDLVLGADGTPVKVMDIPFWGTAPVWRLTLTGGVAVECSDGHLWQTNAGVKSVADMLSAGLRDRRGRRRYWIPQPGPAEYVERPVPVPPYTLGVLLGDGHLRPGEVSFTTADQQIEDRVASEVAPRYKLVTSEKRGNAAWNARIVSSDGRKPRRPSRAKLGYVSRTMSGKWMARVREEGKRADQAIYIGSFNSPGQAQAVIDARPLIADAGDSIHGDLDALGLRNARSHTKSVPEVYKVNSVRIRLAVLQGLMDTDGYAGKTEVSFCSVSQRLAEDVRWLAESLGGVATITTKQPKGGQLAYQVWLRMPDPAEVFFLDRKRERAGVRKSPVRRYIESAEPVGERQCQCITVSANDGLYLTEQFVVTHNSRACLEKMHAMCCLPANAGMRALIVRKTAVSLGSTALVTFREAVAREALASGEMKFYGGSSQEAASYQYGNGSTIVLGGMDKVSRIMSSEYDLIYVQEATELVEDDWEALTTRLRYGRVSFQQIMADCNPSAPHHWLKQRADRGATQMVYCRHEDNPRLFDGGVWSPEGTEYLRRLDALTGVRYERLRLGHWAAAEGLIYDMFDPAVHLHKPIEHPPDSWTRWWGVDFGFTNPFCWQAWAQDPDGRLYLYKEIYRTQTLVEDHARAIIAATRTAHGKEPPPREVVCDHDAEGRATLEAKLGLSTTAAHKSVLEGIEAVKERLKVQPDGKPRLYICRDALIGRDQALVAASRPVCTSDEVLEYIWDDKTKKEQPRKENDHGMDTARYVVAAVDLVGRPRLRFI